MLVTSAAPKALTAARPQSAQALLAAATASPAPQESFERSTPVAVKAGKWALAAGSAAGIGALGLYAGSHLGAAAGVAGAVTGALAGAVTLGAMGLFADVAGGIMGSSNKTLPMALTGGVLGAVGGGAVGALVANPVAAGALALAGGLSAFAVAAASTNLLAK